MKDVHKAKRKQMGKRIKLKPKYIKKSIKVFLGNHSNNNNYYYL